MQYVFSTMLRSAAAAGIVALSVGAASAASIYSEAADGDLDAIGSTNLTLLAGVNTISGSITETGNVSDTDRVKFTQGTGMTVDSIILSFAGVFDPQNIGQSLNSALFNSTANLFDDNFGQITSGTSIMASFMDTFGPETGPLSQDTAGAIWDFQLSPGIVFPAQEWTLTINTTQAVIVDPPMPAPVPLPASAPLILAALGALGLMRRRRSA